MSGVNNDIEKGVVNFLREALAQRYALENIRNYRGFAGLPNESVEALRAFGLNHIYPEWEERCFQLAAFARIMALLENPMRLKPLTAVALKSLWRFGRQLPKAIDAGKQVIEAFTATRSLEDRVIEQVNVLADTEKAVSEDQLLQGVNAISWEDFEAFINNIQSLMRLLSQRALLETGASVLGDIAVSMEKRRDCYDEIERKGVRYAIEVMDEGMALFNTLDISAVEAAIEAVPLVERDWFSNLKSHH